MANTPQSGNTPSTETTHTSSTVTSAGLTAASFDKKATQNHMKTPTSPASTGVSLMQPAMKWIDLFVISLGFLGIQFAWAIQMGQMPALLERLGATPEQTGWIFAAGPITGVLVQPLVGSLSDQTRSRWGRRRPFLLAGAILTALSLILMPNSMNLLMAGLLLWVLDAAINLTQGPYRALVPDVVPKAQQPTTFSLMSLTIGLGSVAAFMIGGNTATITSILNTLGVGKSLDPMTTLFYLGAVSMIVAMGITILRTKEQPITTPVQVQTTSVFSKVTQFIGETTQSIVGMPMEAKKLCFAHSFTWFGLGCLFFFFSQFVPHNVFHANDPQSALYLKGVEWASLCYAAMNAMCFAFSSLIGPMCTMTSKKFTHSFGLIMMGLGLGSMFFIGSLATMTGISGAYLVMAGMSMVGIGWATTLSVPFALLSDHVPSGKEGVLMGTFNIFIAAPQVLTSMFVGSIITAYGGDRGIALLIGGASMIVSALFLQLVKEHKGEHTDIIAVGTGH